MADGANLCECGTCGTAMSDRKTLSLFAVGGPVVRVDTADGGCIEVDAKTFLILNGKRETPELYYGTIEGQFVRLATANAPNLAFDFVK